MKTINIKVPNWFPTLHELRQYKHRFKMWLFPPRCEDCKRKVPTSEFYWKQSRVGTHPLGIKNIMDTFAIRVNRKSCADCMKKYLHSIDKQNGKCTICETENVSVLEYTYIKESRTFITFLWSWWNGSKFCMACIDELLDKGKPETDRYKIIRKSGETVLIPEFY